MAMAPDGQNVARIKADASRSATTAADGPLVYATEDTSWHRTESAAQVLTRFFSIRYHTSGGKAKESSRGSRFAIKIQQSSKEESIFQRKRKRKELGRDHITEGAIKISTTLVGILSLHNQKASMSL